jgi:hypothetical protein
MSEETSFYGEPVAKSDPTLNKLVVAVDKAYNRIGYMMWRAFLQGVMSALGAAFGTFVILGVLAFLFRELNGISYFHTFVNSLSTTVAQSEKNVFLSH